MNDDDRRSSLTTFNFDAPQNDDDKEGMFSKLFVKVRTAVSGPAFEDNITPSHDSGASLFSVHKSDSASISLSSHVDDPNVLTASEIQNEEQLLAPSPSSSSSLQRQIYVTTPTPPVSSKDSVVVNFHVSSPHFDISRSTIDQDLSSVLPQESVSRCSQDESHTIASTSDFALDTPISKTLSTDSDSQSVVTTFSISTSNSLSRILARLRGHKSDKQYWMPDEQCKECYKCRKSFTLLRRRHHCRACELRIGDTLYTPGTDLSMPKSFVQQETSQYPEVLPSQQRMLAAPKMQIPTTAFKKTKATYGGDDATTFAVEIPTHSDTYGNKPQGNVHQTGSTRTGAINMPGEEQDSGFKQILDAGTSFLKPHSRFNTSSSAPVEDTCHLTAGPSATSGNISSANNIYTDRGGGTVVAESELSPFSGHDEVDSNLCGFRSRSNSVQKLTSTRSANFQARLDQPKGKLSRESAGSDDEAWDNRLRAKRREELWGSASPRERVPSFRRPSVNTTGRLNSRVRKIQIVTSNLQSADYSQCEGCSPSPLLSPYTPESTTQDQTIKSRLLTPRPRRISAPPPNVELSYSALLQARHMLRQLMQGTILDELSEQEKTGWEDVIVNLLLKVTDNVRPDVRAGDDMDVRHYVKIKRIPGGVPSDSFYVKGVVCSKNVAHKRMVRNISQPRILILLFSLDYSRVEMENQLLSISPVLTQEREHISKLVGRIVDLRPSLLLVKSTVSRLALEILLEENIPVIHNVKYNVIEAVARCTQASVVSSVDKLQPRLSFGRCGTFEIRTMMHELIPNRRKTYLIFDDCPAELGGTIVLRGASNQTLQVIKRLFDFMVLVVNNLKLETSLLRDSFAKNRGFEDLQRDELLRDRQRSPLVPTDKIEDSSPEALSTEERFGDHADSLDALISVYQKTMLSASLYVHFPPPYLLTSLKEIEDRLAALNPMRQTSRSYDTVTLSPARSTFDRQSTNSETTRSELNELAMDAEYEHLVVKQHQLARARDAYMVETPDYINPVYQQNIVVLYFNVCIPTTVPCQGPEVRIFEYYRYPSDRTLGQYLLELFADAKQSCNSFMCDHDMLKHFRSYVHGDAKINVMIDHFPCPQSGMSDKLLMWSYCRECERPTPVIPMSENTWSYSFGKYLETLFYQTGIHCRADICPHDITRHHVRNFGYMDHVVQFAYDPIELLEVAVPPMKPFLLSQVQIDLKEIELKNLRIKINKFYQSINDRNKAFPFDLVDPRKIDACKAELQEMSHRCVGEKKQMLQHLQTYYATSDPSNTLSLNWVKRSLYQEVSQWEMDYVELVRLYLQPERELKKNLRKIFPADTPLATNMDDERAKRATETTDLPLLGIGLDDEDTESSSTCAFKSQKLVENDKLPILSSSPTGDMYNQELVITPDDTFLSPGIRRKLSLELMHELNSKFKVDDAVDNRPDTNYLRAKSPGLPGSQIPSRIPQPSNNNIRSSVSPLPIDSWTSLTKPRDTENVLTIDTTREKKSVSRSPHRYPSHVPLFSRSQYVDMDAGRRRTQGDVKRGSTVRDRSFRSRLPRKKTFIQVYKRANDLVREDMDDEFLLDLDDATDERDDDQVDYFSPMAPYTNGVSDSRKRSDPPVVNNFSAELERHLPSAFELLVPPGVSKSSSKPDVLQETNADSDTITTTAEQAVSEESKHSPEKSSFMKTITNFLTDASVTHLLPLEQPLQPTEHILPDSLVVVHEDEPSTIIAYTLSCDDYLQKMREIQEMMADDVSDDATLHASVCGLTPDDASTPANIKETLLRESGTHMRYNFSDGTTKFFCKIFFSEQFDALRRNCGCDASYIMSMANCVPWDSSGGKSGSAFLKTKDDRLLMKQMSRYEMDAFLNFAPAYFQYMSEAFFRELPTVLAKIFGFYSIGYKNSATGKSMRMDVLVMENLFYQRNVKKIYDLKGSMRNRHVQSTGKQDEVLLDENLVERKDLLNMYYVLSFAKVIYQKPLFIRAHSKEILRSSLHNDTLFLSGRNVMDYSLLVGIDEERQELVVGIVDFMRTFTWDKKLESWVKESGILGGGGKEPTIVSPRQYRIRFREAMERYFLMVPDLWALSRQNIAPYVSLDHHDHNQQQQTGGNE
ncbi:1-phosphatidylinositol-3-phosphate 5-kinase [Apophysomyces sp. BC1034]|nr:1-phosphatidylinositol-3-phosphate 5-kinase [Apophysomyces sp. BC1015]KAG0178709.1 1-phosphatidylinositol-3-phosphate 5-kinase [Apophysomyces sp. BC1021]KAG0189093.1 1-phosphatidylinositol-3-phosphate 5-kinase [Apophysomyces sp. BC1034]